MPSIDLPNDSILQTAAGICSSRSKPIKLINLRIAFVLSVFARRHRSNAPKDNTVSMRVILAKLLLYFFQNIASLSCLLDAMQYSVLMSRRYCLPCSVGMQMAPDVRCVPRDATRQQQMKDFTNDEEDILLTCERQNGRTDATENQTNCVANSSCSTFHNTHSFHKKRSQILAEYESP